MKTLVGSSSEKENEYSSLNDDNSTSCNGKFDFILEDNVRAFVGMENNGKYPEEVDHNMRNTDTSGWSCECANRIWDIIEASNASQTQCHMRYYGWLGSLPNLSWIYENHIPRSALNDTTIQHDAGGCAIFPYPTNEDFELDSIVASLKSNKGDSKAADSPTSTDDDQLQSSSAKEHSVPQFSTPGGTAAVWGTFAYTVSPAAYHSFINQLQNDVGSLMWKGKKMRAYKCKPIDKLLPRHVKSEYEPKAVHVPSKVAFVRGPMTSLLHPQWDAGFRRSTEVQYHLSCGNDTKSSIDQITGDVWDHVWLQKENGEHSDLEEQTHSREKTVSWDGPYRMNSIPIK
jgi:hypothetical protein